MHRVTQSFLSIFRVLFFIVLHIYLFFFFYCYFQDFVAIGKENLPPIHMVAASLILFDRQALGSAFALVSLSVADQQLRC